jgi:glutamate dehydrogenase (NAD(P)+)
VLVPAAAGSVITERNAGRIRARMVAEGANAPVTPAADAILGERQVFVIPDILCNAGGVFVSYLEYTQETQRDQMTREEVERRLAERMQTTFEKVHERAERRGMTMRHAAMEIAVSRVVDGIIARGLLP